MILRMKTVTEQSKTIDKKTPKLETNDRNMEADLCEQLRNTNSFQNKKTLRRDRRREERLGPLLSGTKPSENNHSEIRGDIVSVVPLSKHTVIGSKLTNLELPKKTHLFFFPSSCQGWASKFNEQLLPNYRFLGCFSIFFFFF